MLDKEILIDKNTYAQYKDIIIAEMKSAAVIGIDTETHNRLAHDGIKAFRKENEAKVFDYQRMVMTGLSIHCKNFLADNKTAYYFNMNHADTENVLTWEQLKDILDAKPEATSWIAHNAPYELVVLKSCYNYDLTNIICTMQMAVSAWGPDEYDKQDFVNANFGEIVTLFPEIEGLFSTRAAVVPQTDEEMEELMETSSSKFNSRQQEFLNKVLGKQSIASFSYNGLVRSIAYSYGLKKLVQKFFNHKMTTYEEVLKAHNAQDMLDLTGPQVVAYGCDDAYWAVELFFAIYDYMEKNCPETIKPFFEQENPMVHVFAETKLTGMKVNGPAIEARRDKERENFAECIREMKAVCRLLLPFDVSLNKKLAEKDGKWYVGDKAAKYRKAFEAWAMSPDSTDTYKQVIQVSSPVSNAWAGSKCNGISIGHYFQTRLMMYDLCRQDPIMYKGKVQSDADSRGTLKEKVSKKMTESASDQVALAHLQNVDKLLSKMNELASIEQRMKLYLTPYMLLTDPDTGRMYPELSSMLATRRMACQNPNAQQLAKRGESTYVRGFFEADSDDELLVSLDWSQVELVEIGEFSGDPEFKKAYGQIPYEDLHLGTAADVLSVVIEGVTPQLLSNLHKLPINEIPPQLLVKPNGEPLDPKKAKKYWRTEVGKGANFNYFYSGALSTVGEKLGWTSDQMWKATEAYRERFAVAEAWRVGVIQFARENGYVMLPDGHRRNRWEATYEWTTLCNQMLKPYADQNCTGIMKFMSEVMRATRTRGGNQVVNALIQGSSATLTKRSILKLREQILLSGLRAKFKVAVHDEVIFSVHKDYIVKFIDLAKAVMTNHPDIIKNLKLYCTASIGRTFEPYDGREGNFGQIELDECPPIPCVSEDLYDNIVPKEQIPVIVDWIMSGYRKDYTNV